MSTSIKEINARKSKNINPSDFPDELFELYSVPSFDEKKPEVISGSEIGSTKQIVEKDEVLICKINPRINRVWKVGDFTNNKKIASSEWIVVNTQNLFNSEYLKYLFSAPFYRDLLVSEVSGVGGSLTRARPKIVENYEFPIAPLNEQNRIATKLDQLFGHLDNLKERLDSIPELLKQFRQALLNQAVTGKLTEEWRKGKNLSRSNFKQIINDRLANFKIKQLNAINNGKKRPIKPEYLKHDIRSIESHILNSWYKAPVGFLCDCIVPGRDKPKSFTGNIPWITTPDLTSNYIDRNNAKLFLSDSEISEVNAKKIPANSVVISIVGRFGISCVLKSESVINQQLHAFLPSELVLPEYLMYFFKTQGPHMKSISSSTTISYINKTKANNIVIDVPSILEQTEIVKRLEILFTKADTIEYQYKILKEQIDNLPQKILAKAFRGELVEQNPDDETAEVLLEKIKKKKLVIDKTKSAITKRKTKKKTKKTDQKIIIKGLDENTIEFYNMLLTHFPKKLFSVADIAKKGPWKKYDQNKISLYLEVLTNSIRDHNRGLQLEYNDDIGLHYRII